MSEAVGTTQGAKRLQCSLGWVYVLLRTGELPATRLKNKQWLIPVAAIEERRQRKDARTDAGRQR